MEDKRNYSRELRKVIINVAKTKYWVIVQSAEHMDWEIKDDITMGRYQWDVMWMDSASDTELYLRSSLSYQRINHFPAMQLICKKDKLAQSIINYQRISNNYNFTPKTWLLPDDIQAVRSFLLSAGSSNRCVIVKPNSGAQGRGIFLANSPHQITDSLRSCVVQTYVHRPFLVEGLKFDLRIYVLVTCCDPLRILLFREGLCRFCTCPYSPPRQDNLSDTFMHLTNYSINKLNENFVRTSGDLGDIASQTGSSKRSISWLNDWMGKNGHNFKVIWEQIADMIVKTLIVIQAPLSRAFKSCKVKTDNLCPFTCFEVLGFDVLLDEDLQPYLLEVNDMPSFSVDSLLDAQVKSDLIQNVMKLINVSAEEHRVHNLYQVAKSKLRIYGQETADQFRRNNKLSGKLHMTKEQYWKSYLSNEEKSLGQFDLVYPTNCYPDQPTGQPGRQELYDNLIHLGQIIYDSGFGGLRSMGISSFDDYFAFSRRKGNSPLPKLSSDILRPAVLKAVDCDDTVSPYRGMVRVSNDAALKLIGEKAVIDKSEAGSAVDTKNDLNTYRPYPPKTSSFNSMKMNPYRVNNLRGRSSANNSHEKQQGDDVNDHVRETKFQTNNKCSSFSQDVELEDDECISIMVEVSAMDEDYFDIL